MPDAYPGTPDALTALTKLFPWIAYMPNLAPRQLDQDINSGWSFGNVTINAQNSRAPDVEQAITAQVSYGRQIGRMMEAMEVLITELPPAKRKDDRVNAFDDIAARVRAIKAEAKVKRLERLKDDLAALRREDPKAWKALVKGIEG